MANTLLPPPPIIFSFPPVELEPEYKLGDKINIELKDAAFRPAENIGVEFIGKIVAVVKKDEEDKEYLRDYLVKIDINSFNKKLGDKDEVVWFTNEYGRHKHVDKLDFDSNTDPRAECIWITGGDINGPVVKERPKPVNYDGATCAICNTYDSWADTNTRSGHFVCYNCRTTKPWLFKKHGIVM